MLKARAVQSGRWRGARVCLHASAGERGLAFSQVDLHRMEGEQEEWLDGREGEKGPGSVFRKNP